MEKINFINGKEPALNGANLNQLQTNVENAIKLIEEEFNKIKNFVNVIYPIGSIYISANEVNPKELFEGTKWEQMHCSELINSGTDENGYSYRIYSDGYCEVEGTTYFPVVNAGSNELTIPLPVNFTSYDVQCTMVGGGSYWAETRFMCCKDAGHYFRLSIYHNNQNAGDNQYYNWKASGYSTTTSNMYKYKRIS